MQKPPLGVAATSLVSTCWSQLTFILPSQLCENVRAVAASLSSSLASAAVEVQQACYLPMPPDGLPLVGQVPGLAGVYVATGHSCWGILNGPATGMVVAELIVDNGVVSCLPPEGVEMLSPARLVPW